MTETPMSAAQTFYDLQAQTCADAAQGTDLPMLRDKYERASAAWLVLARREKDIASARARRMAETEQKTAQDAALSAPVPSAVQLS